MSHPQPTAESNDELSAPPLNRSHHAIVPSDEQQDLVFRSIRAIDPLALQPHGAASLTATRRTPKGVIPMIWVKLNETRTSVVFEVTVHTGQCIQVHVPIKSWKPGNCDSEAVRAAIQRAYLDITSHKPSSVIVRPGTVSLEIFSKPRLSLSDRIQEWRDRKRRRREKANKPGAFRGKERMDGDPGELGKGSSSGSGSGSGELTYSISRSSASSDASENSPPKLAGTSTVATMYNFQDRNEDSLHAPSSPSDLSPVNLSLDSLPSPSSPLNSSTDSISAPSSPLDLPLWNLSPGLLPEMLPPIAAQHTNSSVPQPQPHPPVVVPSPPPPRTKRLQHARTTRQPTTSDSVAPEPGPSRQLTTRPPPAHTVSEMWELIRPQAKITRM